MSHIKKEDEAATLVAKEEDTLLLWPDNDDGRSSSPTSPGRGRPPGRKDRRSPLPRIRHHDDDDESSIRMMDRGLAKFELLQVLIRLFGAHNNASQWRITAAVRHLYALTHSFETWLASGRSVDALALQLRTWLKRDLLPLANATHVFTAHLADEQWFPCAPARLSEMRLLVMRAHRWLRLEYNHDEQLDLDQKEGQECWRAARDAQKQRESDAALFALLWTLD